MPKRLKVDKNEIYKELLAKAIELGDEQMIKLAESMKPEEKPKKKVSRKKVEGDKGAEPKKKDSQSCVTSARSKPQEKTIIDDNGVVRKVCRSEPISVNINFVDTGEFKNDKANKILKKFTSKVQNSRGKSTVVIKCGTCKKEFDVSPIFIRDGIYTCDACGIGKIRNGRKS